MIVGDDIADQPVTTIGGWSATSRASAKASSRGNNHSRCSNPDQSQQLSPRLGEYATQHYGGGNRQRRQPRHGVAVGPQHDLDLQRRVLRRGRRRLVRHGAERIVSSSGSTASFRTANYSISNRTDPIFTANDANDRQRHPHDARALYRAPANNGWHSGWHSFELRVANAGNNKAGLQQGVPVLDRAGRHGRAPRAQNFTVCQRQLHRAGR